MLDVYLKQIVKDAIAQLQSAFNQVQTSLIELKLVLNAKKIKNNAFYMFTLSSELNCVNTRWHYNRESIILKNT